MQFSTEHVPAMNVSKEADLAFMRELERTEPERYRRLIRNMEVEAIRQKKLVEMPGKRCLHCNLPLPTDARTDAAYCDRGCQQAAYRARMAA